MKNNDTRLSNGLGRWAYIILFLFPIGIMAILTVKILLPSLKDPQSKIYPSKLGYPALQRLAGKPIAVKVAMVKSQTYGEATVASGQSVALENIQLTPLVLVSGIVDKVFVKEGQRVRKGQPLIKLEQAPYQLLVKEARVKLATARAQLASLKASSAGQLAKLKADLATAQDRLSNAKNWVVKYDESTKKETKDDIEQLKARMEVAQKQLELMRGLVKDGGISLNQFYQAEDNYFLRKQLLADAEGGLATTENQLFTNRDFYASRKGDVLDSQVALESAQKSLEKELESAQLNVDTQKLRLEEALRNLQRTVLYANIDGLVSGLNIDPGEIINSSNLLPVMNLTNNVVFKAFVDQARLNTIKIGDYSTVRLVAYPGRTLIGRVIRINPTVGVINNTVGLQGNTSSTTGGETGNVNQQYTYSVWVSIDKLQMPPGLQGYAQFSKKQADLVVVPESSLIHLSNGEGMAMVVEGDKVMVRKVKLERKFGNQRRVIAGLKQGEKIVLYPNGLIPGDRITVTEPK